MTMETRPPAQTTLERLFEPGTSSTAFAVFNAAILGLLLCVGLLYARGVANIHALVMSLLAAGLCASVNFLVYAVGLEGNPHPEDGPAQGGGSAAAGSAGDKKKD